MFSKTLEQMAKKMFQDLAIKRTGVKLDWKLLSPERRLVWTKEVAETFLECLAVMEKDLNVPLSNQATAGYERGFIDGRFKERQHTILRIEGMKEHIEQELNNIIEREARES